MRLDYTMYALAIVFFIITAVSFALVTEQNGRSLYVVSAVVLGVLSITFGYFMRPKTKANNMNQLTTPTPSAPQSAVTIEGLLAAAPKVEASMEETLINSSPVSKVPELEFAQIRGINKTRATELMANGIKNLKDLAKASPEDLAAKLKVSPKIVKMWIGSAKKLVK